jgi:hypothetical protein
MSVGPLGLAGSAAGSHLAQTKSSEDRSAQQTSEQSRTGQMNRHAEQAAGIGQTEEDQQAFERDADGRRPWEIGGQAAETEPDEPATAPPRAPDPKGERGTQLDLSG